MLPKILQLENKDKKTGKIKNTGRIEIKNQTEEKAELYFYGDIVSDSWSSWWTDEDKCPQDVSDFLRELDNSKDLDIFINSGGGSVFAGIAIYSMLKRHNGKKTVHVDGLAASIASVIALAGDEVIIPKYATFMIHNPLCFLFDAYNANDLRKISDSLDNCKESILNIYLENVKEGVTKEELSNLMDQEKWFTGEGAAEYFNIKVEDDFEAVACASGFFDKYKNTPKNLFKNDSKAKITIDADEIANKVIKAIEDKKQADKEKYKNKIEEEKRLLLEDLDLY
ncbi:head maturation protease, ClpP-related [Clostridium baratii]|uniref:head maturation protease, ClpP-related n=1 Tax=Clostridium baratii TaxID=1561 RepID=UPI003D7A7962